MSSETPKKSIKKKLGKMEAIKGFVTIPTEARKEFLNDINLPSREITVNNQKGRIDNKARIWALNLQEKFSEGTVVEIIRNDNNFEVLISNLDCSKPSPIKSSEAFSKVNLEPSNSKPGFNGLSPKEWTLLSKSVWTAREVSSPREWYHLEHGATFSVALAERAIQMYTKKADLVLDPFLGVGTTLVAAKNHKRRGIGIELYKKFADIAKVVLSQQTLTEELNQQVICGDNRELLQWVEPNSVQLMFTSPPYANFIQKSVEDRKKTHKKSTLVINNKSVVKQYGQDSRDFGNLSYDDFLNEIKDLMEKLFAVTTPGGYNVWVIKDVRDTKNGKPLIDFHSDIARIGKEAGFLYHDLIIWDQNDQRRLVLLGYPSVFYVNVNHTFLVVLRKHPNHEKAVA